MLGDYSEVKVLFDEFPPSSEYAKIEVIRPLYEVLFRVKSNQSITDDPLEATYENAIRLTTRGNLPGAMDGLIDILRQDKHYHVDEVRKVLLGLFEILGTHNPLTQQYRQELALILF